MNSPSKIQLLGYFKRLPKWDYSKPDYITELANYVEAADQEAFNVGFKKMLVRTVSCAIGKIPFNKYCFVLNSNQGIGKTGFLKFLCPPLLKAQFATSAKIEGNGKFLAICENLFINLDELTCYSKYELKKIRVLFEIDKINHRKPYAQFPETFRRTASFIACTNYPDKRAYFVNSDNFLSFDIKRINHDKGGVNGYNQNIDIDLVYSQAYALANGGFNHNPVLEN